MTFNEKKDQWNTSDPPQYLTKYMTPPLPIGHFIFNSPSTSPKKFPTPPEYNRPPQLVINDSSLIFTLFHLIYMYHCQIFTLQKYTKFLFTINDMPTVCKQWKLAMYMSPEIFSTIFQTRLKTFSFFRAPCIFLCSFIVFYMQFYLIRPSLPFSNVGCCCSKGSLFR